MNEETSPLSYMPLEIIFKILLPLSYYDILNICSTSTCLRDNICRNKSFWHLKAKNDFGISSLTEVRPVNPRSFPSFSISSLTPIQEYMLIAGQSGRCFPSVEKILGTEYCFEKSLANEDVEYLDYLISNNLIKSSDLINRICWRSASKKLFIYLMEKHLTCLSNDRIFRFLTTRVIWDDRDLFSHLYSLVSNNNPISVALGKYFIIQYNKDISLMILEKADPIIIPNIYHRLMREEYRDTEKRDRTEFFLNLLETLNIPFNPEMILERGIELSSILIINQAIKYGAHRFLEDLKTIQHRYIVDRKMISYLQDLNTIYTTKKTKLNNEIQKALKKGQDYLAEAIYYMFKHFNQTINGYNLVLFLSRMNTTEIFKKISPEELEIFRKRPTLINNSIEYFKNNNLEEFVPEVRAFAQKYLPHLSSS